MSSKPETTFIASVHRQLAKHSERPYYEKMNNPYRGGTPDVWYSGLLADIWVEYKFHPSVPQRGTVWLCKPDVKSPLLSVLQADWLRERYREGRKVFVIVGCPTGGVLMRDLEWENPFPAKYFTSRIQTRADLANWIACTTLG